MKQPGAVIVCAPVASESRRNLPLQWGARQRFRETGSSIGQFYTFTVLRRPLAHSTGPLNRLDALIGVKES
jgi:hypothetical protein